MTCIFLFFFSRWECAGDPSSTTQTLTVGCRERESRSAFSRPHHRRLAWRIIHERRRLSQHHGLIKTCPAFFYIRDAGQARTLCGLNTLGSAVTFLSCFAPRCKRRKKNLFFGCLYPSPWWPSSHIDDGPLRSPP